MAALTAGQRNQITNAIVAYATVSMPWLPDDAARQEHAAGILHYLDQHRAICTGGGDVTATTTHYNYACQPWLVGANVPSTLLPSILVHIKGL